MNKLIALFITCFVVGFAQAQDDKKETKPDSVKKETKKKKDLPLEAGRKVAIKSSEGTWMSLDISPDGKTIAFDFLGDIYLLPITGGKAKAFTARGRWKCCRMVLVSYVRRTPRIWPDPTTSMFHRARSGASTSTRVTP